MLNLECLIVKLLKCLKLLFLLSAIYVIVNSMCVRDIEHMVGIYRSYRI
jgi:hypothetical protein